MADLVELTVGGLLEEVAAKFGDRDAVVYPELGLRLTYKEFDEQTNEAAKAFMALGIEKGDHLAVWTTNQPEWLTTQFATGKMGAVLVTVNTSYRASELEYLLRQSESGTFILQESFRDHSYIETLYEIIPELKDSQPGELQSEKFPHLRRVIVLGDKSYPGTYTWSEVMQMAGKISHGKLQKRKKSLHRDDVINMQYTSGTTGFPKGVMLTHYNIVNNAINIAEGMKLTQRDRMCIPVPFFHCFGCVLGTLTAVSAGAAMVPLLEFNPRKVLQTVQDEKCTALHGVPTMFIAEMNLEDFESYNLSSLRTGIMAGSTCPIEVMKGVVERMGASELTIVFGQTESSPGITQTRTDDPLDLRVTSIGRPMPNIEVKIVEPGTEKEVPKLEHGELITRGYHVMKGYYNDPHATKAAISPDGWLHTGDLAVMDDNGYCSITGRLKDMIIRGGENIYPREIEEFLYQHPQIMDVQVIGVPDEKYGEELMAWIIPREGHNLTAEVVRAYCEGKISRFKIPRYIEFIDEYPMTASGKIQKYKLREKSAEILKA
ncbi:AMP-binding protein [Gracilibacillus sp. Marseille-QA3620]